MDTSENKNSDHNDRVADALVDEYYKKRESYPKEYRELEDEYNEFSDELFEKATNLAKTLHDRAMKDLEKGSSFRYNILDYALKLSKLAKEFLLTLQIAKDMYQCGEDGFYDHLRNNDLFAQEWEEFKVRDAKRVRKLQKKYYDLTK